MCDFRPILNWGIVIKGDRRLEGRELNKEVSLTAKEVLGLLILPTKSALSMAIPLGWIGKDILNKLLIEGEDLFSSAVFTRLRLA